MQDPRLADSSSPCAPTAEFDAVAVYAADDDWRIVIEPGKPAIYLPSLAADALESVAIGTDDIDPLAPGQGVLADLFPRAADVA